MVKLSRIIKKIVDTHDVSKKVGTSGNQTIESLASKGKTQPTIDFSNLPSLDKILSERESVKSSNSLSKLKKVVKSQNKNKNKLKNINKNHEQFKSKVLSKNKVDRPLISNINPAPIPKFDDPTKSSLSIDKQVKNIKDRCKVNKESVPLSRGKRKRELKKEAWRRKNEFKNEAIKIITQNRKEDKHGKPLSNLNNIKDELQNIEESIRLKSVLSSRRIRPSKLTSKLIKRTGRIFEIASKDL